jgi:hypothetical protein
MAYLDPMASKDFWIALPTFFLVMYLVFFTMRIIYQKTAHLGAGIFIIIGVIYFLIIIGMLVVAALQYKEGRNIVLGLSLTAAIILLIVNYEKRRTDDEKSQ